MCDAALLVVESDQANREVVRQAGLRLAESGVRLLGVILNKRTYPIPEKLYRWI
jgi:Mrp family chromosome partitioning ATPase